MHLFVTQEMAGFLTLNTAAKFGQQQGELQHRELVKETILQKAPCAMGFVVWLAVWLGKQKGKKWGYPQTS